jgi:hypothetical protein
VCACTTRSSKWGKKDKEKEKEHCAVDTQAKRFRRCPRLPPGRWGSTRSAR